MKIFAKMENEIFAHPWPPYISALKSTTRIWKMRGVGVEFSIFSENVENIVENGKREGRANSTRNYNPASSDRFYDGFGGFSLTEIF